MGDREGREHLVVFAAAGLSFPRRLNDTKYRSGLEPSAPGSVLVFETESRLRLPFRRGKPWPSSNRKRPVIGHGHGHGDRAQTRERTRTGV